MTGGDSKMYRMLNDNLVQKLKPQYKLHLMCNDPPKTDGHDQGLIRRLRKIDYVSKFVPPEQVDPAQHCFPLDPAFMEEFMGSYSLRMELLRLLLDNFDRDFKYSAPPSVLDASSEYLPTTQTCSNDAASFAAHTKKA